LNFNYCFSLDKFILGVEAADIIMFIFRDLSPILDVGLDSGIAIPKLGMFLELLLSNFGFSLLFMTYDEKSGDIGDFTTGDISR
jgi:hypothetical protein